MVKMTDRKSVIVGKCNICDYEESMLVCLEDVVQWKAGSYIQEAMPYLTAEQRELLISSTCNDCWNLMFPQEDWD